MRQRTEVFATIILLATVLRQGRKKKRLYQKSVSEFYRLLDFFILLLLFSTEKEIQNVYCIDIVKIIKLLQISKCIC